MSHVEYSIDGKVAFTARNAPYTGKVRVPTIFQNGEIVDISARVVDIYGYSSRSSIQVRIGEAQQNDEEPSEEDPTEDSEETLEEEAVIEEELEEEEI